MDFGSCVSRVLNMLWLLHLRAQTAWPLFSNGCFILKSRLKIAHHKWENVTNICDEITEQILTQKSALRVEVSEWQGATNLGGASLANSVHKCCFGECKLLIKPWLHSSFSDRTWTCNFPYFNKVREDPLTLVHISLQTQDFQLNTSLT